MTHTTDTLKDINQWLGWGDPKQGVWFVGIEEGATFTPEKISAMRGRQYYPVRRDSESELAGRHQDGQDRLWCDRISRFRWKYTAEQDGVDRQRCVQRQHVSAGQTVAQVMAE